MSYVSQFLSFSEITSYFVSDTVKLFKFEVAQCLWYSQVAFPLPLHELTKQNKN